MGAPDRQESAADGGGVRIRRVVYQRRYSAVEVRPTEGTLVVDPARLSFEGAGHRRAWDLAAIAVERLDADLDITKISGPDAEEHLFAHVDEHACDVIRAAADAARRAADVCGRGAARPPRSERRDGLGRVHWDDVLYYTAHHKTAVPTRGILLLAERAGVLSFRCKDYVYRWDLAELRVEKFRGRIYEGVKLFGPRVKCDEDAGTREWRGYTFTRVNHFFLYLIRTAIERRHNPPTAADGEGEVVTSARWGSSRTFPCRLSSLEAKS